MGKKVSIIGNVLILVFVVIGTVVMLTNQDPSATGLTASGFENLKYYTVLSNELCGIAAILSLLFCFTREHVPTPVFLLHFAGTCAAGVTFLTIAAFLGPIYGHSKLYQNSNLYFHLIVPLLAVGTFVFLPYPREKFRLRYCLIPLLTAFLYGSWYTGNLLINGVGEWPDTNDWYGFLNWGIGGAVIIALGIHGVIYGIACLLRTINRGRN